MEGSTAKKKKNSLVLSPPLQHDIMCFLDGFGTMGKCHSDMFLASKILHPVHENQPLGVARSDAMAQAKGGPVAFLFVCDKMRVVSNLALGTLNMGGVPLGYISTSPKKRSTNRHPLCVERVSWQQMRHCHGMAEHQENIVRARGRGYGTCCS